MNERLRAGYQLTQRKSLRGQPNPPDCANAGENARETQTAHRATPLGIEEATRVAAQQADICT
jgi:hypothetical protein